MKKKNHYFGDVYFQELLDSIECPFFISEVRAFILGAILATEPLTVDDALDFVLKDEKGGLITFPNDDKEGEFIFQFFALWDEILVYRTTERFFTLSTFDLRNISEHELLHTATSRANEIKLFLVALCEGRTDLSTKPDELFYETVAFLERCAESMHEIVLRVNEEQDQTDLNLLENFLYDTDDVWKQKYFLVKKHLLNQQYLRMKPAPNNVIHADFKKKSLSEAPSPEDFA